MYGLSDDELSDGTLSQAYELVMSQFSHSKNPEEKAKEAELEKGEEAARKKAKKKIWVN